MPNKTFYYYITHRFINKPKLFKQETKLNDKILVRKHLEKEFNELLPICYHIGSINECDFSKLPLNFVIKPRCMYGGKGIKFIQDGKYDIKLLKRYYSQFRSNRNMGTDVIIEELLYDKEDKIISEEYKFFVFHGKTKVISIIQNINKKGHTKIDYDVQWNRIQLHSTKNAPLDITVDKPDNLNEMLEYADKLGEFYTKFTKIPFVRVDMYNTKNGIKFGEFTGGPNGGRQITAKYQKIFGSYWKNN